jgi:hypothetical protein
LIGSIGVGIGAVGGSVRIGCDWFFERIRIERLARRNADDEPVRQLLGGLIAGSSRQAEGRLLGFGRDLAIEQTDHDLNRHWQAAALVGVPIRPPLVAVEVLKLQPRYFFGEHLLAGIAVQSGVVDADLAVRRHRAVAFLPHQSFGLRRLREILVRVLIQRRDSRLAGQRRRGLRDRRRAGQVIRDRANVGRNLREGIGSHFVDDGRVFIESRQPRHVELHRVLVAIQSGYISSLS